MQSTRNILLIAAVVAGVSATPAAEAAPIPQPLTCGMQITEPGSYRATNSVRDCGNAVIIDLTVAGITLDLDGRVVGGDNVNCDEGITVAPGAGAATIRNGIVRDCADGVDLEGSGTSITVKDIVATSNTSDGIVLESGQKAIGNTVTNNDDVGIRGLDDNTVSRNSLSGNEDYAIVLGSEGTIARNRIVGNEGAMEIQDDNDVSENVIVANNDGIDASDNNRFTANVIRSNVEGISVSGGNRLIENTVIGNESDGILADVNTVARGNVVKDNRFDGIDVNIGSTVIGNTVNENGDNGIRAGAGSTTKIKNNVANNNGLLGIDAGPGVLGAGTNRAKGNGSGPPQCDPEELCV